MLQVEVPFAHAHACPFTGPRFRCQMSGEFIPFSQRRSWRSMALREMGEMRLEWPETVAASAANSVATFTAIFILFDDDGGGSCAAG